MNLRPVSRDDAMKLYELLIAASEDIGSSEPITPESVARQFDLPGIDVTQCMWVMEGAEGALDAVVAAIPLPGDDGETVHVSCHVHPGRRGGDLEERLLRFAENQAPLIRRQPGQPLILHAGIKAAHTGRAQLLEKLGYTPVRRFLELQRSLDGELPPVRVPAGMTITDVGSRPEEWHEVFRVADEAFRDHWHQPRISLEQFQYLVTTLSEDARLVLLARDSGGSGVGALIAHIPPLPAYCEREPEAEIALLGVLRPFRRRGVGTCLLAIALHWARERHTGTATIGVDSESLTGADRLYRDLGFTERSSSVVYHKIIS